jgi:hypothetical protein
VLHGRARRGLSVHAARAEQRRGPSDWDCFSTNNGVTLATASAAIPAGLTLNQWPLRIELTKPTGCSDSVPRTDATLDGEPAQSWTTACASEDLEVIKLVAFHATRGYIVLFASPTSLGLEADRATLDPILRTFRFAAS